MSESKSTQTSPIEILKALGEPLPESAIQHTKGSQTHKGYDTDGYGYQAVVDRFNEVLGASWGFTWEILKETAGKYKTGNPYYDITVLVKIWVETPDNIRACVGGHIASLYADALKGAITNAFKKTAAFWGPGRQAYLGMLDDDNKPLPEEEGKGMRENGHAKNKPESKPAEKSESAKPTTQGERKLATKEQHNQLSILPMFIACQNLPEGTFIELTNEANAVYQRADEWAAKNNKPIHMPGSDKLSEGRAGSIIGKLKVVMSALGFEIQDALTWWNLLPAGDRSRYSWWEETDEIPF